MNEPQTPGEAAFNAWNESNNRSHPYFSHLQPCDQVRWNRVADAVIRQSKAIIAQEMVKAAGVTQQIALEKENAELHDESIKVMRELRLQVESFQKLEAALDDAVKDAYIRGLREAAEIAGKDAILEHSCVSFGLRVEIRDAILAKAKEIEP